VYQPPWEINPLEYLVGTKVPLALSIAAASSPHASANTHERARVAEDQAARYREELKALPPNEIARLAKKAALAMEEEAQLRRELEENERFFNQPRADMDVTHWSRMSYWTLDEAVVLSLGKDQRVVKWNRVKSLAYLSPFASNSGRGAKLPFAPSTPSACGPSLRAMLFRLRRLPIPGISGTMNARG
jgi:hypothetical protein